MRFGTCSPARQERRWPNKNHAKISPSGKKLEGGRGIDPGGLTDLRERNQLAVRMGETHVARPEHHGFDSHPVQISCIKGSRRVKWFGRTAPDNFTGRFEGGSDRAIGRNLRRVHESPGDDLDGPRVETH